MIQAHRHIGKHRTLDGPRNGNAVELELDRYGYRNEAKGNGQKARPGGPGHADPFDPDIKEKKYKERLSDGYEPQGVSVGGIEDRKVGQEGEDTGCENHHHGLSILGQPTDQAVYGRDQEKHQVEEGGKDEGRLHLIGRIELRGPAHIHDDRSQKTKKIDKTPLAIEGRCDGNQVEYRYIGKKGIRMILPGRKKNRAQKSAYQG